MLEDVIEQHKKTFDWIGIEADKLMLALEKEKYKRRPNMKKIDALYAQLKSMEARALAEVRYVDQLLEELGYEE